MVLLFLLATDKEGGNRRCNVNLFSRCCPLCVHTAALQALVGHRYGRPSLPTRVEVTEFQLLLQEGRRVGVGTQELERSYRRDENSIPPSYWLRLRPQVQVRTRWEQFL